MIANTRALSDGSGSGRAARRTGTAIVAVVASAYRTPSNDLEPDVDAFLDDLERRGLITSA